LRAEGKGKPTDNTAGLPIRSVHTDRDADEQHIDDVRCGGCLT
jgi:hypothetical protein